MSSIWSYDALKNATMLFFQIKNNKIIGKKRTPWWANYSTMGQDFG